MKRILSIIAALLLCSICLAQKADGLFERTYVSLDKETYVAGERMWCSAFCFDLATGALSSYSSVAYLQLVSSAGTAASAKISLECGRGSGYLDIPETLPTGNYSLIAFTAINKNETGYDFMQNARIVPVFNVMDIDKIPDGVEITPVDQYEELTAAAITREWPVSGVLALDAPSTGFMSDTVAFRITNPASKVASFSISVWHDDNLAPVEVASIASFNKGSAAGKEYVNNVIPEYDGEVIYANITGPDADKVFADNGYATAYISTLGAPNDTYTALTDEDGHICFKTYNIFGNKDMVCQVNGMEEALVAHLELQSPFVTVTPEGVPVLKIAKGMERRLVERGRSLIDQKQNYVDTLYEFLPRKENVLLFDDVADTYILDDYTRFPTMSEVLVEIVHELRARGKGDKLRIQILSESAIRSGLSWDTALVMLDGVPIFNHQKIMDYDAMLISKVSVWQTPFFLGKRFYNGVANFETSAGGITYIDFGSNVRIVDFKGVSYPMSFTKAYNPEGMPDIRQTIWWQPLRELGAGETVEIKCATPDYAGKFRIVVEGVLEDGTQFCESSLFFAN